MNRQETTQIITLLAGNYNNIAEKDKTQKQLMIATWQELLGDLDYKLVLEAVKRAMINSPYPPTIHDIRKTAVELINPTQDNALEAWDECLKMMSNGLYMTQEEFDKHSPICKRFVGSLRQLRNYGETPSDTINTVVKSNFLKQYENIKNREREEKLLPEAMKKRIALLQNNVVKRNRRLKWLVNI